MEDLIKVGWLVLGRLSTDLIQGLRSSSQHGEGEPGIGKDSSGMDLIATDGLCIIRTKAVRKVSDQWDADFLIGMTDGPMDFFGHSQVKARQKIVALSAPSAQEIDEEAEAVRDLPLSEGYSASEPFDYSEVKQRQGLVEGAGLGKMLVWNISQMQEANFRLLTQVGRLHHE